MSITIKDVKSRHNNDADESGKQMIEWLPHKESESCFNCAQIFEKDSIILAAYGLLFCSIDCVQKKFPDADSNDIEEILASDIGIE